MPLRRPTKLLPNTIIFAEREFQIMSCDQARSEGISGQMRCFTCKGDVEDKTIQYVYHGVDVPPKDLHALRQLARRASW